VVRLARETLGGNGILLENHIMRHLVDIEAPYTYEGSWDLNMFMAGREIVGVDAIL
jgi:glutaryl-CoA dehydrogenase